MALLTFPGAARTVTGSQYLLEAGPSRLMRVYSRFPQSLRPEIPEPGESVELMAGAAA